MHISIHVPRAGYDLYPCPSEAFRTAFLSTYPVRGTTFIEVNKLEVLVHFYPRTPCGVRLYPPLLPRPSIEFLSTYPVRGTTNRKCQQVHETGYFYPRTPCGVRLTISGPDGSTKIFLSTYPVRGTTQWQGVIDWAKVFLSTYPVRGTTRGGGLMGTTADISIHVPRAGYDIYHVSSLCIHRHFYPRTPCGVRRFNPYIGAT